MTAPLYVATDWTTAEFDAGPGLPVVRQSGVLITDQDVLTTVLRSASANGLELRLSTTPFASPEPDVEFYEPFVRWDVGQSLTDGQQAQALENLGLPAGGPGGLATQAEFDALEATLPSEYVASADLPGAMTGVLTNDPTVASAAAAAVAPIVAGGVVRSTQAPELGRNRVPNPQLKGGPADNTAGAVTYVVSETTTGLPAGFSYGAQSVRASGNNATVAVIRGGAGTTGNAQAILVTPGEKISLQAMVWSNDPATGGVLQARIRARFLDSSGTFLSNIDTNAMTNLATSTWEARSLANITVPASAALVELETVYGASTGTSTTGSTSKMTACMVVSGATLAAAYADGTSPLWAWTGTAHASPSIQIFKSATDLAAMAAEVGAAAAVQANIYTGLTYGKNLYNPADPDVANDSGPNASPPTALITQVGYRVTGFIPVTAGQQITCSAHRNIWFANASKVSVGTLTNTGNNATVATYTVPAGAVYVRVQFNYVAFPTFQLEIGSVATGYQAWQTPAYTLTPSMVAAAKLAAAGLFPTDPVSVSVASGVITVASVVNGLPLVITCGKTTSKQGGFNIDGTSHNGVAVAVINDEVTPIRTQMGTVGGNHGYFNGIFKAPNPDGKTTADLGSRWHDTAGNEYVLLAITANPSVPLTFGIAYTGTPPAVVSTNLPTTNLTHVSGATHTGAVPFGTIVSPPGDSDDLTPSLTNRQLSLWMDRNPVTVDGGYSGRVFEVRESYEILDYASIYDTAKANVGVSFSTLPVASAVLVQNVYRFGPNGVCRITTQYDELLPTTLSICGAIQAVALAQTGKTTTRYVPGMGTVGGFDWSAGVDYTSYATTLDLPASSERVTGRISAFHMDTLSASGTVSLGFAMGYLPFGNRADSAGRSSQRLARTPTSLWNMRNQQKAYPAFTNGETAGWGHLVVEAFRAYLSPAQVAAVLVDKNDALTSFGILDTQAALTA